MNLLVHDYAGHPFQIDLSRELARKGCHVTHVYTSASGGPKGGMEEVENLTVIDLEIPKINKSNFYERRNQEIEYGKKLVNFLKESSFDLVISSNTPLDAQKQIVKYCNSNSIPFVFWLQDIISIAMKSILRKRIGFIGNLVSYYYQKIELKALKDSNHIVLITDEFKEVIQDWGIPETLFTTIPNWAPIEDIPVLEKENEFSISNNLTDKFVVLYSGTLGMKHNPQIIVDAALELLEDEVVKLVVVSEGEGMNFLRKEKELHELNNLILLPFQPFKDLPKVLASADCTLTLLEPEAGIFSVPSKVWSGFCAQKPSLLLVPPENLAAKVTEGINAGFVIGNEDSVNNIVSRIYSLKNDKDLKIAMGKRAREYAEKNFFIKDIVLRFENVFNSLLNK